MEIRMDQRYMEQVEWINKQIKEMVGIYRDAVKQLDISETEFWIWYTLITMDGDYTQQDICSVWSLPKQTVNTIVTHMKEQKYAYLEALPGTRNHKIIRLTDEGREYGAGIVLPIFNAEARALEKISPDELALVTNIFRKYMEAIREEFHTEGFTVHHEKADLENNQ